MKMLVDSKEVENIICTEVSKIEAQNIMEKDMPQIIDLIKSLYTTELTCCGLSAPQIGMNKKFFVYSVFSNYEVYFNCHYFTKYPRDVIESEEGCYSYSNGTRKKIISRYKKIIVKGQVWNSINNSFDYFTQKLNGFPSCVFQHEIDHHGNGLNVMSETIFVRRGVT
jgi:peptide deformylase